MQIAAAGDVEVDQAVACDLVEHVFEERYAGIETAGAAAIEVDDDADLRFERVAPDFGGTCGHGRRGSRLARLANR